jgi:serine-type D-Ala-D-Ala carboxypeptidase/endopeptidase (penicillin-binding protein 4)
LGALNTFYSPIKILKQITWARVRKAGVWGAVALAAVLCVGPCARAQKKVQAKHAAARADVVRFEVRAASVMAQFDAGRANWGIYVADRDSGEILYEMNPGHFFAPASTAKIVTTAMALAVVGSDYRFRTTLESKAVIGSDGRLKGDIVLVGRGDPDLSNVKFPFAGAIERDGPTEKALAELVDGAIAKGLREIDGDIIADDSFFPFDPYPAGWEGGDLFFEFGAPVSAIAFNENILTVEIRPGERPGDPAIIVTEPKAAADSFSSALTTAPPGGAPYLAVVRQASPNFILLRGTIPLGHAPLTTDLAMTQPAETAASALKQQFDSRGVRVTGTVHVQHAPPPESTASGEPILPASPPAPPVANANVLAERLSPSLAESVGLTNKTSQNLHAEIYLRMAGLTKLGLASTAAGLKVERDFLRTAGVPEGEVALTDGSGLARDNLVTPRAMVALLRYAAQQPWGAEFRSSLPVAGVDGTLENRMRNTAASGLIQAKTGTVEHSCGLVGYATTTRGESLIFAIYVSNDPQKPHDESAAIDAIATAMVETLGSAAPPKRNP